MVCTVQISAASSHPDAGARSPPEETAPGSAAPKNPVKSRCEAHL